MGRHPGMVRTPARVFDREARGLRAAQPWAVPVCTIQTAAAAHPAVTFKCEGGVTGVHSVIEKVPSYNFTCGFAQASWWWLVVAGVGECLCPAFQQPRPCVRRCGSAVHHGMLPVAAGMTRYCQNACRRQHKDTASGPQMLPVPLTPRTRPPR